MKNMELTLDQLTTVAGGVKEGGCIPIPKILRPCFPMPWPDPSDSDTTDMDIPGRSTQPSDQ